VTYDSLLAGTGNEFSLSCVHCIDGDKSDVVIGLLRIRTRQIPNAAAWPSCLYLRSRPHRRHTYGVEGKYVEGKYEWPMAHVHRDVIFGAMHAR